MLLVVILAYILAATGFTPALALTAWFGLHWFITLLLVIFLA